MDVGRPLTRWRSAEEGALPSREGASGRNGKKSEPKQKVPIKDVFPLRGGPASRWSDVSQVGAWDPLRVVRRLELGFRKDRRVTPLTGASLQKLASSDPRCKTEVRTRKSRRNVLHVYLNTDVCSVFWDSRRAGRRKPLGRETGPSHGSRNHGLKDRPRPSRVSGRRGIRAGGL